MSGSLNKVQLIGHLGKDPEIRTTQSGDRIANFSVATSEKWKDRNTGEAREATEWHRVVIFSDGLAGIAERFLNKGSKVFVEGQLKTRKWNDQQGVEKYTTEVVIQNFNGKLILLDGNRSGQPPADSADDYGQSRYGGTDATGRSAPATAQNFDLDDEIPF